jgi:predicted SnoaL-like aldol condensation-catalyzing enzyme
MAFYNEGFVQKRPRCAFERYTSIDFVEHKPDVEGGTRDSVIAYLEALINSLPNSKWELLRTIAEGELVFLHARFTPAPGEPAYAIADIFRLRDGLIVEHWDVVGPPPPHQLNPNPRF